VADAPDPVPVRVAQAGDAPHASPAERSALRSAAAQLPAPRVTRSVTTSRVKALQDAGALAAVEQRDALLVLRRALRPS
jgi:hypothetical protein